MTKVSILDPSELKINVMGINVEGFSKGTFVNINRTEPYYSQKKSLKGKVQLRVNVLGHYTFKFTLDNTSQDNTWLHAICRLQQKYGIAFPVPLMFRDMMGFSTFFCPSVYIEEPATSHGSEVGQTEWTLVCNNVSNIIGGNRSENSTLPNIISQMRTFIGMAGAVGTDLSAFLEAGLDNLAGFITPFPEQPIL